MYVDLKKYSRIAFILFCDIAIIVVASYVADLLGYSLASNKQYMEYIDSISEYLYLNVGITVLIYALFGLYTSIWEFASINEGGKVVFASLISASLYFGGTKLAGHKMPLSYFIIYFMLLVCLIVVPRFSYRIARLIKMYYFRMNTEGNRIMVIGAGRAANMIIKDINTSIKFKSSKVVCAIDDSDTKIGKSLQGVKVVGTRKDIVKAVKKYKVNEILYAIPSASSKDRAEILNMCKETKCKLKTLPSIYQLVNENVNFSDLRSVEIEDLLCREPIRVDVDTVISYVHDKTILVTGGGGSIGSELCRQIASHHPKQLIIFDIYENNAYDIQNELKRRYPELNLEVLIGSVRDDKRVDSIFNKYRPNIVYHAAAHKHVPLMEDSPNEAIKNNVFGTFSVMKAADKYGVSRFVLISSDKAVNPTNVMGATKRICEMIGQSFNRLSKTDFVAVRFGNVLGSNGSVVPLFKQQIKDGGPVLVTHPDIIRYFMTISEAVSLVIEAGAIAKGGEIFILDMGQPVKIIELAENLIKLSGLRPYIDIDIKFTGLRPGEKLYEELLMAEEGLKSTQNKLIHIGKPIDIDAAEFFGKLESLRNAIKDENCDIREHISEIVPTYYYNSTKVTTQENDAVAV